MTYGIANKSGRPNLDFAKQIVKTAWENGIREYDTGQGYGESENVLGNALHSLGFTSDAKVTTKLDPNLDHLDKAALEKAVKRSLSRLNVPILHGLMLHREEYLQIWETGLGDTLRDFVTKGLTEHIGVSVYSPDPAMWALKKDGINMIQIPSNILDRRFEKAGVFRLAEDNGKQIYIRSVFLQGLLLINNGELPKHMSFALPVLKKLEDLSREVCVARQELALSYVKAAYPEAKIVFGAETPNQVDENIRAWKKNSSQDFVVRVRKLFANVEEKVLNPILWKQ